MLLNYSLKLILRTPKRDKYVLVRKWCSEVSEKDLNTKSGKFRIYKQLIMDKMHLNTEKAIEFLNANGYILKIPVKQIIKISNICQYHKMSLNYATGTSLQLFQLSEAEVKTRILILKEMGVKYLTPIMLNSSNQFVNMKIFRIYARIDDKIDIAERLYSYLHEPPPDIPQLQILDENVSIRTYRMQCLSHYLQWRLNISPNNKSLLNKILLNLININFSRLSKSFTVLHDDVGMSIKTIRDKNCLEHCSPEDLKMILCRIETICGVSIAELIELDPTLIRMRYSDVSAIKKLLEKHNYTGVQLMNCPKILLTEKADLTSISQLINKRTELKVFQNHPKIINAYLLKDELDLRIEYLNYLKFNNTSVSMLTKPIYQFDKVTRVGKLVYDVHEISWVIKQHLSVDISDIRKFLCKHPFWNKIDLLTVYDTLQFLTINFDENAIKKHLHLVLYSKEKIAQVIMEMIDKYGICSSKNPYTTCQIMALCVYELEKRYHFTGDGVWDKGADSRYLRTSLRLGIILNHQNNRKNLFKNNPDDHFYSCMTNNDIKNDADINTKVNMNTEVDVNSVVDINDEIDIDNVIDINVDTNFKGNNHTVICNSYDHYNEMYDDEFDDDYDNELQFNHRNKT